MVGKPKASRPAIQILTGPLLSAQTDSKSGSQSPRTAPKTFDLGGIGLGIVAALQKSGDLHLDRAVVSRSLRRSLPVPVNHHRRRIGFETPYSDFRIQNGSAEGNRPSVFHISPARLADASPASSPSDFLKSCYLCGKKLHGKDIYMYRGEKAFCSTECRYRQIVVDEPKEKCGLEAPPCSAGQIFSGGGGVLAA